MKRTLVIDAGSTKTDCALVGDCAEKRFETAGVNAAMLSDAELHKRFSAMAMELGTAVHDAVRYYGAGCATPEICARVAAALSDAFGTTNVETYSDMVGAAKALFGDEPGIACILGTGSNSCLYDGRRIVDNVPSLGYVLGDEGSGAALGKRLVSDVLKRIFPEDLCSEVQERLGLSVAEVIRKVYREPNANRYLASMTRVIYDLKENEHIRSMATAEFERFFERNVCRYSGAQELPIGVVGSVGYFFSDLVDEAAARKGLQVSLVMRSPMEGLIKRHADVEDQK